jgi:hypothetical protein
VNFFNSKDSKLFLEKVIWFFVLLCVIIINSYLEYVCSGLIIVNGWLLFSFVVNIISNQIKYDLFVIYFWHEIYQKKIIVWRAHF